MTPIEIVAIVAAGLAAGTINTIVGSGSLITFPTLLALGYAPVVANVSNTVGLVPGSLSGVIGYRRELVGQRSRALRLGTASVLGGLTGGVLLLALPASSFERVVPFLILIAVVLVALQPRLSAAMARRRTNGEEHGLPLGITVYLTGIYGGYFGAAQGVILIALLGIFVPDDIQRLNGLKNVLAFLVNGVAAILFVAVAPVSWPAALLLAVGSITGGQIGAVIGRRLSPLVLRGFIIVVGTIVALKLLIG
ncbi:MAG TPA: sulfite exporter TauE/SafE family protein [Candidatus Limnocylindrales bacterium]|nr:sulfite exporter TauE/SafE family protein [Candidatus Limnocylindrales bacterium]